MDAGSVREKYQEWRAVQDKWHQLFCKARKDPALKARIFASVASKRLIVFQPRDDEIQRALSRLPAYCIPATTALAAGPLSTNRPRYSFLGSFPGEVRNAVYQYVARYPTCDELSEAYHAQLDAYKAGEGNGKADRFEVKLYTPNILLLCKQITAEALSILRLRPLVIDRIPPWYMDSMEPLPWVLLLGPETLQNLRFVQVKPTFGESQALSSAGVWHGLLQGIMKVWATKNSLIRLKVMMRLHDLEQERVWHHERRQYLQMIRLIDDFARRHGARPDLVEYEHWIIDLNRAYTTDRESSVIRALPDRNIWTGGGLEWV